MRTTLTLDSDTRLLVERYMRERKVSMKVAVNTAIRQGLTAARARTPQEPESYTTPRDLGSTRYDLTKALSLAYALDDARYMIDRDADA